jgi:hypothetical protein
LIETKRTPEKSATSTPTSPARPRWRRRGQRKTPARTTSPGATKRTPSHGSVASRSPAQAVSRASGRSRAASARAAAPASALAATASGAIVVAATTAGGDRPTASTPRVAHGSGTRRRAIHAAAT